MLEFLRTTEWNGLCGYLKFVFFTAFYSMFMEGGSIEQRQEGNENHGERKITTRFKEGNAIANPSMGLGKGSQPVFIVIDVYRTSTFLGM